MKQRHVMQTFEISIKVQSYVIKTSRETWEPEKAGNKVMKQEILVYIFMFLAYERQKCQG